MGVKIYPITDSFDISSAIYFNSIDLDNYEVDNWMICECIGIICIIIFFFGFMIFMFICSEICNFNS